MTKLKHFSMLVLLAVAAQGAQAQQAFELGRPLYRDGDWNTLCLPFSMTDTQIANSPLAGAVIKELDGDASELDYGTLYLSFKEANSIVAGTPYIVRWADYFTIRTADDWSTFVANVSKGETYEGKTVQLAADISIGSSDMVGNKTYNFMGTFDGGGHTITCNITDNADQGAAPFFCIKDATIKNLKVTGSVQGGLHSAGLVGFAFGTNTIMNCEVTVNVTCSGTHCGGILGHGQSSTTTISNCLYSGTITGNGSTQVGVIYGWADDSNTGSHTIKNCLANGIYNSYVTLDLMLRDGNVASQTVTNCYKNVNSGSMGTYFSGYSASTLVTSLGSEWQEVDGKAVPVMAAINNVIENPVFNGVTIGNTLNIVEFNNNNNGTNKCAFKGNFTSLTIDDNNRNSILLLTAGNKLGYAKTNRTLSAYSAYFEIPVVNGSRAVHSFVLDFGDGEETGITAQPMFNGQSSMVNENSWYTLDGRRLDKQPTKAGLYINNGRKVIIK